MKSFYMITSENDPISAARVRRTTESLKRALCAIPDVTVSRHEGMLDRSFRIPEGIECVITIGGDGTMLRAARAGFGEDIRFIGINRGHMGYLTEMSGINNYGIFAKKLVNEDFFIEERMMLSAEVESGEDVVYEDIALNEVLLCQYNSVKMLDYDVYVNDCLLNSYKADGLIAATPTGSTGYSMSAGGPIAEPSARLILLTPICPHSVNVRSMVLSHEDRITVIPRSGKALVSCDGSEPIELSQGDRLSVVSSECTMKFIKFRETSFMDTLRDRMRMV